MAADHGIIPDRADLMHIDMGNGLRTHSESVSGSPHGRGVPEAAAGVIMKWLCSGSPGRSCAELRYVGEAASIASCTYGHGGARTAPGMLREKRDVPERTTEEDLGMYQSKISNRICISLYHLFKIRNFGRSAFAFTMTIPVSPQYPSHYLYSINTCACDLCA